MDDDPTFANAAKTRSPQIAPHQFREGNPGGPGRPKGSRNKLGEKFIEDLYADWMEHGIATLQVVRAEKPDQYLKVVATILPKDMNININKTDDMTDDELVRRIRELSNVIEPFLAAQGASGTDDGVAPKAAH